MDERPKMRGFTLVELMVVVAILGILSALAIPQLIGVREKARTETCDNVFQSLDSEIVNELDSAVEGGKNSCGKLGPSDFVDWKTIDCVLSRHRTERNPRDRNLAAYVDYRLVPTPKSCQVVLSECQPPTEFGYCLLLKQYPRSDSVTLRTYRIRAK